MEGFFGLLGVLNLVAFILGLVLWIKLYTFLGNALTIYLRIDDNLKFVRDELETMNKRGEVPSDR